MRPIRGKNALLLLMDSLLEGQYANDDATYKLVELASKCLQSEPRDWPDAKFLLVAVTPLQILKNCLSLLVYRSCCL